MINYNINTLTITRENKKETFIKIITKSYFKVLLQSIVFFSFFLIFIIIYKVYTNLSFQFI